MVTQCYKVRQSGKEALHSGSPFLVLSCSRFWHVQNCSGVDLIHLFFLTTSVITFANAFKFLQDINRLVKIMN